MVKQLLRARLVTHHLHPEVTFKKMWTAKSLCGAQILLHQLKEARLGSLMFPKSQRFQTGILNYCTIMARHDRVKFQVGTFVVL